LQIHLVRHAIAADAPPPGGSDVDRALTPEGIRRFRSAALGLGFLGVRFDRVLTSPLVRAAETARLLVDALELPIAPEVHPALAPGGSPRELFASLSKAGPDASAALVGHEPDLSTLASYLLSPGGPRVEIALKKGGVCRIDVESLPPPAGGLLRYLLTPRVLRAVGKRE